MAEVAEVERQEALQPAEERLVVWEQVLVQALPLQALRFLWGLLRQ